MNRSFKSLHTEFHRSYILKYSIDFDRVYIPDDIYQLLRPMVVNG